MIISQFNPCRKCKAKTGISVTNYSFENQEVWSANCEPCGNRIESIKSEELLVNKWNQLNNVNN